MRNRSLRFALLVSALAGLPIAATSSTQSNSTVAPLPDPNRSQQKAPATPAPKVRLKTATDYGRLPISFEANRGQTDKRVSFVARGSGYGLYLNGQEAVLALHAPQPKETPRGANLLSKPHTLPSFKTDVVRMQLRNANPAAQPEGVDPLPGTANYFTGKDPAQWHTNIPTYSKVRFSGVYPGVDLVYYGNQSQLEYDFVVAPNADANAIKLHFTGASKLALTRDGDLSISAKDGQIAFHKPVIYQEKNGQRQPVDGRFTLLADRSVGFSLGRYDRSQPLIIDPVLAYSTYLGGSVQDSAAAIAVDGSGNAYVAGFTESPDFPVTQGAYQSTQNGSFAFVTKLDPTGTTLLYSTYLGGSETLTGGGYPYTGYEEANGIAVDSSGNAYVMGGTGSSDFPVTQGAYQTVSRNASVSAFITKLNPTGTALLYSTYLSGPPGTANPTSINYANGIAIDGAGNAYVAGSTTSIHFPVTQGAIQRTTGPSEDGCPFVTKLNAAGSALIYSTYLGQLGSANAIAVDGGGNAYVTGTTAYFGFPTTPGALQPSTDNVGDTPFVSSLNPAGTALNYSTYLGGNATNWFGGSNYDGAGNAIAIDGSGNAYVAGVIANDPAFPITEGAFQTTNKNEFGRYTSFVTKFNSTGSGLIYSTYLGGSGGFSGLDDEAKAIAVDAAGNAYVAGFTGSLDFSVTAGAFQTVDEGVVLIFAGDVPAALESETAFVSWLDPTGSSLIYSTYLGGSNGDEARAIAVDNSGNAYVAGLTQSYNFPVTGGSFQTQIAGSYNAFVAKLNLNPPPSTIATNTLVDSSLTRLSQGGQFTLTAKVASSEVGAVPTGNVVFTLSSTAYGSSTYEATVPLDGTGTAFYTSPTLTAGQYNAQAGYIGGGDFGPSRAILSTNFNTQPPFISPTPGKYIGPVTVTISDTDPGATLHCMFDGTSPTASSPVCPAQITIQPGYEIVAAIATSSQYPPSLVSAAPYTVVTQTPTPVISPAAGPYAAGLMITIADAIPTATIRYTTDGSIPTTKSTFYAGPIFLTGSETINAIAIYTQDATSQVATATYTTVAAAPTFSPTPGQYAGSVQVMLSDTTPNATIHYTTDGSSPNAASPLYGGPISISSGFVTVRAIAIVGGNPASGISEGSYSIVPQTPTPVISPGPGAYVAGQLITISDATPGATIRYTLDGSTPTLKSTYYTSPIVLTGSETIQAVALGAGEATSDVASASFTVQ